MNFDRIELCGGIVVKQVAEVLVNVDAKKINQTFTYIIPDNLDFLNVGWRVVVPFGARTVEGFILQVNECLEEAGLKRIIDTLDDEPWFNESMLSLAQWISSCYLCNLVDAMRLFIPGRSGIDYDVVYSVRQDGLNESYLQGVGKKYLEVIEFLSQRGTCNSKLLKKQFGAEVYKVLHALKAKNIVLRETNIKAAAKAIYKRKISLAVSKDVVCSFIQNNEKRKPAQVRLLKELYKKGEIYFENLKEIGIHQDRVKPLVDDGVITIATERVIRDSYSGISKADQGFTLTEQQKEAVGKIAIELSKKEASSFLLHGITGSGKTQVYIEAVKKARAMGRKAIILVPEIGLTGQIVSRFKARFGEDVVVIHSKLSKGERFDAWGRLKSGESQIVIGARSAIFAPLENVGIIIIDEEHEFTYKQEETPRYHVKKVALEKAKLDKSIVVLGSATPSIESYYRSLVGEHILLNMHERIDGALLPEVDIVDMRQELKQGRRNVMSKALRELIQETLIRKEQAIILLNRRGYATFVMCRECGYIVKCKHCDVSMVYHSVGNRLRCHYCQREESMPDVCPQCSSRYIRYFGTGTQKVEEELAHFFPNARVIRMDQDTTGGKLSHDRILSSFAKGDYDILLGTQMVAKGHDIKNVTAVGIISADSILNLPDFRSAERVFAMITQAAGRAGRGKKAGKVVVQTYNPDHYAVKAGVYQNYESFYQTEVAYRKSLHYPPFSRIVKFTVQATDGVTAEKQAIAIMEKLKKALANYKHLELIGPFWSSIAKLRGIFRMNILLKSDRLEMIVPILASLDLVKENVVIDVDPLTVM